MIVFFKYFLTTICEMYKVILMNSNLIDQLSFLPVNDLPLHCFTAPSVDTPTYLESINVKGGGVHKKVDQSEGSLDEQLMKTAFCGKACIKLFDNEYETVVYKPISCNKWFCPSCNKVMKAKRSMKIEDIVGNMDNIFLRQHVFTCPEETRSFFWSRDDLNALFKMAKRAINRYYPDHLKIATLHIVGDKSMKYHPHINVLVVEHGLDKSWKVPQEIIDGLKETWLRSLRGYTQLKGLEVADVHYSYRVGKNKIKHAIRYMVRPFSESILIEGSDELKELAVLKLKGMKTT